MADQPIPPASGGAVPAADEEERFRARVKEKYGIDDDPETFKEKRSRWAKAEEEIPQYQQTLTSLINHYKQQEALAAAMAPPPPAAPPVDPAAEEERLRTIAKLDPYEGMKRVLARKDQEYEQKLQQVQQASVQQGERAAMYHQTLRRSKEIVDQNWPEANDPTSELFKAGYRIFHQEMAPHEQQDPRSFLIATERAAGRLGVPPKSRRGSSTRRESLAAQSVSRDRVKPPEASDDDLPLSGRQKLIVQKMGVTEKTYREAIKNRKAQTVKDEE